MKISVIAFTKKGGILNEKITLSLREKCYDARGYIISKYLDGTTLAPFNHLQPLVEELFQNVDGLIFIGACGIAVRSIAPFIKSKTEDPAVLVVDERGIHVISLLSGHIGGANDLSKVVADITGGIPIITTSTDCNEIFAVDTFAMKNNLVITDTSMIKEISSRILNGEKIGFYTTYPVSGSYPTEIFKVEGDKTYDLGFCITNDISYKPFLKTLSLLPKNLVLGIGCRKGVSKDIIMDVVMNTLDNYNININRINKVCSIDIKAEEKGLLEFVQDLEVQLVTYCAELLNMVEGDFNSSSFVKQTVGVDNVCERSAMLGSGTGKRIVSKTASKGVTIAVYEIECTLEF